MTETGSVEPGVSATGETAGARLRAAREAGGLSIADVAARLHLDLKIVEALEAGDDSRLPAAIFVRGYLRSYARLVGVSEAEVLGSAPAVSVAEPRIAPALARPRRRRLPALPWQGLGLMVLVLALGALGYALLPPLIEHLTSDRAAAPEDATPDANTLALPAAPLPVPAAVPASLPEASVEAATGPDRAPEAANALPLDTGPVAVPEAVAEIPAAPEPRPRETRLSLRLDEDAWIDIRDANGRKLAFGLLRAGTRRELRGVPPLRLKIGNADAVHLQVDGRDYDLSPHMRGDVARFRIQGEG
ncbi:RodZ domain-containing protein [Thiohalobacter sp.]|uniref:RodZ domain-containing protein n=1 Tax=Thiohalobacter sp. TaxID=2025948 RepID=UPI00260D37F2|nr:RodZ domain-containing protein [Thiohalobacter sp.]